jgi:hypothetical protein
VKGLDPIKSYQPFRNKEDTIFYSTVCSWIDNKKEFSFLESTIFLNNIFLVITSTEIDAFDFFVYLLTQKK